MRRRVFLAAAAAALAPLAYAQARLPRIGFLLPFPLSVFLKAPTGSLVRRLESLGYRDGAGATYVVRSADGASERYPALARELLGVGCDIIFTLGPEAGARALLEAKAGAPVVFLAIDFDPLEKRLVGDLRRPGGNLTGVYTPTLGLAAKRLEIAQEVAGGAKRFLVLSDLHSGDQLGVLRQAAEARGARLHVVEFERPAYDYPAAIRAGRAARAQALIGLGSPVFFAEREKIAAQLGAARLPAVGISPPFAESGYLLSYGADLAKLAVRAAEMGARVLKGAKPGEMPVEQTDEFELVVNARTAKALELKIPFALMARATRVIE